MRLFCNICAIFYGLIFFQDARALPSPSEKAIKKGEPGVISLISGYGITDERVIQAIAKVDRRKFVPEEFRDAAYDDIRLAIGLGKGQRITLVRIVAQTAQLLKLTGKEKILEIGTGSGYQVAVIAELVKEVYTIEIDEPLAKKAHGLLDSLGYKNIKVKCGDGFAGWNEFSPYDIILVGAFLEEDVPLALIEQLAEGGRIVIPLVVGEHEEVILKTLKKVNGNMMEEWLGR